MKKFHSRMGCGKMMIERKKVLSTLVIIILVATVFLNVQTSTVVFRPFVLNGSADSNCANNASAWDNSSWLNVTVESKRPRILWYDFQKCINTSFDGYNVTMIDENSNWISKRNNMTETDNETWYRFIINISSDQGWDNIEYINISGWHDAGNDTPTDGSLNGNTGYNRTGNRGANRNFFLIYDNTTGTATYNMMYPSNGTEITIGNFSELTVTDTLGISGNTETHNISFCFKPGFQFRYAPGPGETKISEGVGDWINDSVQNTNGMPDGDGYDATTCCWESFDNTWSWNFNITVENAGENWEEDSYKSWVNDEFGIYSYTEIVEADDATILGAPDGKYSTNGSSHFNQVAYGGDDASDNVTVITVSNGNYSMTVNITDLFHSAHVDNPFNAGTVDPSGWGANQWALQINNSCVYVRGGNQSTSINFSNEDSNTIWLYGWGDGSGTASLYQTHEVNGTCKYTGEANLSDTGPWSISEQFPNGYTYSSYGSPNSNSTTIEFAIQIPNNQIAGKYTSRVYYHLMTQTHS